MNVRLLFGWIMTIAIVGMFAFAGVGQAVGAQAFVQMWQTFGYPHWFMVTVGILELLGAVLLLVPRTIRVGAGLLSVIMLGAVFTHLMHAQAGYVAPPIVLILLAIGAALLRNGDALKRSGARGTT